MPTVSSAETQVQTFRTAKPSPRFGRLFIWDVATGFGHLTSLIERQSMESWHAFGVEPHRRFGHMSASVHRVR